MFEVNFQERNVRIARSQRLFAKGHTMRFEWIALLAYQRRTQPAVQAWVGLREIARLPHWQGKSAHHIGTNVGRYIQRFEENGRSLVVCQSPWAGPYQLNVASTEVTFDRELHEVRTLLRIGEERREGVRREILRFAWDFVQAQSWVYGGRLSGAGDERGVSAYRAFLRLAEDRAFSPHLRMLACIAAVNVQYRLGLFQTAESTLQVYKPLLRRITDASLKSRYYLALAWGEHRRASDRKTHKRLEAALNLATAYAGESGDRAVLGEVADRMGAYLTKQDRHEEAIASKLQGLEAHLITGSFDRMQACSANIGSVIHRLNEPYYREARCWLLLSLRICHRMKMGRDSAHTEIILAKMDLETGRKSRARYWLRKAETVARRACHHLDICDTKVMWALWHQRFGKKADELRVLTEALRGYRRLQNFDSARKEHYLARKFPDIWLDALFAVEK